jgi:hypothetical protein
MFHGDDSEGFFYECWFINKRPLIGRQINHHLCTYTGEFNEEFQRHGKGVSTWPHGDIFEGEYREGQEVKGKYTFADGRKYKGECKSGNPHGKGTFKWPDGRKYEGEWVDGNQEGYGKGINEEGDTLEGLWKNNQPHGKVKKTRYNKDTEEGEWIDGM